MEPPPSQPPLSTSSQSSTQPSPSQPQPPSSTSLVPQTQTLSQPSNPNPTNPLTSYPQQPPPPPSSNNVRGAPFTRPWSHSQPTTSQFSHFPSQFHPSSSSSSPSPSISTVSSSPSLQPRSGVGVAIGVPAVSSQPPPTAASAFSSSFGAHYAGAATLPRTPADTSLVSSSSPSQARPTMHGMQGMGIIGSQIRPGGVAPSALHPQRPVQTASGIRPQAVPSNLSSIPQNFQGHAVLRASSVTPSSTSTSSTSQSQQSPHQPWLSAPHGRPPLPSQSVRPQVNSQSLQQRTHISQQSPQALQSASQPQQLLPSPQQHFPTLTQSQDSFGQQPPSSRVSQPLANQQQLASFPRVQGLTNQRPPSPAMGQPSIAHSGPIDDSKAAEISEPCNTILSKRNIQELVNQIDPSEKLDPEVEDVLVDIAEDFIDSVTTFGCSLAKHRKSNTLEAKDILLHLERTWNMTLPGFSGDEIKTFKKPVANEIHKERLALIKRSLAGAEMGNTKASVGPATGNAKGHIAKATTNVVGS